MASSRHHRRATSSGAVPLNHDGVQRYRCQHDGCDKSFIRKEHLTRHALSHSSRPSYICRYCQRAFLRNDVLKRHVSRHTASVEAAPRNKRACDGCHAKKLRCDGGMPCSLCLKKGLVCTDDRGGKGRKVDLVDEFNVVGLENSFPHGYDDTSAIGGVENQVSVRSNVDHSDDLSSFLHRLIVDNRPRPPQLPPTALDYFKIAYGTTERITRMTLAPTKFKYSSLYFRYFHHRWPVLHAATFDEENDPCVLTSSVFMIGAWLDGTIESGEMALAIHARLMDHIMPRMSQKVVPVSKKSFNISLYRAALLNIIFGLYTGKEEIISRVLVVRNILITVLRESGLFQPFTQMPEDVPGIFVPFQWVKKEQRKRLAVCLFKVDAYLAAHRGQPAWLNAEELSFTPLPSTFSFWNANGIIVWDSRTKTEPAERKEITVYDLIGTSTFPASRISEKEQQKLPEYLLAEDIELGLAAIQPSIFHYTIESQVPNIDPVVTTSNLLSIEQRLNFWKQKIDQFRLESSDDNEAIPQPSSPSSPPVPLRYYFGMEDHSLPVSEWHAIVRGRVNDILSDSTTLYHFFCLSLYADVHSLRLLLYDEASSSSSVTGRNGHITTNNNISPSFRSNTGMLTNRTPAARAYEWAQTSAARRALWHTAQIVKSSPAEGRQIPNAISQIANSAAMIVIWAFNRFSMGGECAHGSFGIAGRRRFGFDTSPSDPEVLELTTSSLDVSDGSGLDMWIDTGCPGGRHVEMLGFSVCQCMAGLLMGEVHARCFGSGDADSGTEAPALTLALGRVIGG